MSNIKPTLTAIIKKIYKKAGYLDRYGGSLIITGVVVVIFWLLFSYHMVKGRMKPIRADWVNQRCHPAVIPFAGMINAPESGSKFAFTASNFSGCVTSILKELLGEALKPIYYTSHLTTEAVDELHKGTNAVRKIFADVRSAVEKIVKNILNRALNLLVPILRIIVKLKDIFGKTSGSLVASLLTTLGIYEALKRNNRSFFGVIGFSYYFFSSRYCYCMDPSMDMAICNYTYGYIYLLFCNGCYNGLLV